MPEIAADEPRSVAELEAFRSEGRAWVALDRRDRPAAYLLGALVDGCAHVDQCRELAALVASEALSIPGDAPRVAMRRLIDSASS